MIFAIKAAVSDPSAETFTFGAQKTMYGGKHIAKGDTIFVFASENEGGPGLIAMMALLDFGPSRIAAALRWCKILTMRNKHRCRGLLYTNVEVDYCLAVRDIAKVLVTLTQGSVGPEGPDASQLPQSIWGSMRSVLGSFHTTGNGTLDWRYFTGDR